jgi:PIN domain nuclease of toxin-antitoxin system
MGSIGVILLDTCAIIWDALEPCRLSTEAKSAIEQAHARDKLIVSDISLWEIAMLIKQGRLTVAASCTDLLNLFLQSRSVSVQCISPEIAELSVNFNTELNNDPADRIIAATSLIHNARLVTADKNMINNKMLDTVW